MATSDLRKKKTTDSDKKREDIHEELNEKDAETKAFSFEETLSDLARQLLVSSQIYKQPRMNTLAMYERLYNNDILPKLRQMFNVPLPIFSGMIDELLALFNDQVQIKFKARNPSQQLVVPKIQAHWEAESKSTAPTAMWDYKARTDRFNAMLSGRGIMQEFAFNDPEYTNVLHVVNYSDFHCQPMGGGVLENHTFCGTEGNFATQFELKANEDYDQTQVDKLITFSWSDRMFEDLNTTYGTKFARWKALGLDPQTNNFTGERTYNLCNFVITYNGVRYRIVFEPCSGIWLRVKPWKDEFPSGRYPWKSWATHEDNANFWSKSYADDFFPIADAVITMFNQELTNREKKNFNSRAFDKDMFQDVAKLDAAQYRPDSLVPANTMGGTKRISEGIYAFQTAELQGTIDLIQWTSSYTGQKTGADEPAPVAGKGGSKNVAVMLQAQAKQSKRIGLRSDPFKEFYTSLGVTFVEGMREYMPPRMSVQIIGENGFIEEQELKRIDIEKAGIIGVSVTSTTEQEASDALKKDGQVKAIEMVAQNPNLTVYERETIYRNIGQFDEGEIQLLLDTQGKLSKKQYAHASQAIQAILLNKKPDIYYGADVSYLTYIKKYIIDNKEQVKGNEAKFSAFIQQMIPIVDGNMQDMAKNAPPPPPQAGQDGKQAQPPAPQPQKQAPKKLTVPAAAQRVAQKVR